MSLLSLQRHPIHTIALGHLDTNMALLSLMIVPICMTITKEFKFQCGSIIIFMGALTCKRHIPLDSNVVLLLLFASALSLFSINFRFQCGSIITWNRISHGIWQFYFRFQCGSIITTEGFEPVCGYGPLDSTMFLLR